MDVESVRSGRSERSDRSRKLKRVQMVNHGLGQQVASDEHMKLTQRSLSSVGNQAPIATPTDSGFRPFTPNMIMPSVQQACLQPRQQTPYTVYNWASPPPCPNYPSYPTPYNMGWPNQMHPVSYPQSLATPFNGSTIPQAQLPQQQGSQIMQPVQSMLPPTGFIPMNQQPTVMTSPQGSNAQSVNGNNQSQPSDSFRPEHFEAHIPHHDDTAWVEDATAVTGATSETGLSGGDNLSRFGARFGLAASLGLQPGGGNNYGVSGAAAALIRTEADEVNVLNCSRVFGVLASSCVALGALLSPILMLLLPQFPFAIGWVTESCKPTCESHLIGISVKLALLSLATWVISSPCRPLCAGGSAILPRVRLCRTLFLCLVFVVLFAFWLFYTVRILQPRETEYLSIVLFADSLTDTLLFLHYAGIGLMELRKGRHRYAIHIVRSPDGMSKTLKCGEMSVQRAAVEVLQFYMVEFTAFTPGQSNSTGNVGKRGRRGGASNDSGGNGGGPKYKFYDVDGGGLEKSGPGYTIGQTNNNAANAPSTSARLFEELELEKRTRKRKMRLLLAVEEAFTHVRRLATENYASRSAGQAAIPLLPQSNGLPLKGKHSQDKSLDPYEAAQAVFPTLIRPLQKYMRITRQQARHPVDMVIDHLALCLAYGMSPHAFLERFNPLAATPQMDAAAAATAIITAKRDRKQRLNNQPQKSQQTPNGGGKVVDTGPLLPKRVHPGGQQAWSIVADRALSRSLADGAIFQLRRGTEVSLLCTVRRLPLIRLIEEALEPLEVGRFTLNTDNAV